MDNKKIKVLVIAPSQGGVSYFRSLTPHQKLDELYPDEFDVEIKTDFDWSNPLPLIKYDIITFNKGDFGDRENFLKSMAFCKDNGIKVILDLDDYWNLNQNHPLYHIYKSSHTGEKVVENIRLADYVTTTTDIFAEKIKALNKNVKIFPNAVDPALKQFEPDMEPMPKEFSKDRRLRIGFVMGSTHVKDMEQIEGLVQSLDQDTLDKVQFVLCGFDLSGTVTSIDPNTGEVAQRPIKVSETSWFTYERFVTNNYKLVSDDYRNFLFFFDKNKQYPGVEKEPYRREWTKDLNSYATHYDNIDVLFVPLAESDFNCCKSELKMIEAGFKNKGIVMSDVGPYKIGSKSLLEKGGKINEEGNCILIDPSKKHKDWAKAVKKLANNPELIEIMRKNLNKYITANYNLNDITKQRAEFYKEICSK